MRNIILLFYYFTYFNSRKTLFHQTNSIKLMNISYNELRDIKHQLPTGSVKKIASALQIDEQTVRNYFGAKKYDGDSQLTGKHIQPGPNGGIVNLESTDILDLAKTLIAEKESTLN